MNFLGAAKDWSDSACLLVCLLWESKEGIITVDV